MKILKERLKPHHNTINMLCFVLGAFVIVYLTNNFFAVFAPFIVAYVVTQMLKPILMFLNKRTKIPNVLCALICLLSFISVLIGVGWLCVHFMGVGISKLIEMLSSEDVLNSIISKCQEILQRLQSLTQFLHVGTETKDVAGVVGDVASEVIAALSNLSIGLALQVPNLLIAIIIGCIAAFYMLCDYDKIANKIKGHLSPRLNLLVDVFNNQALKSFVKMIFSYIIISAVCFSELLVGFLIIGIDDAVLMALIIATLDVLPILGSGAVLVPWGIVSIIMGHPATGIGLILLWGVIVIVRQIIEPKIVGAQIGLHPLVTIASLYVGVRLMGGLGLIVAPLYIITYQRYQSAISASRVAVATEFELNSEEKHDGNEEANDSTHAEPASCADMVEQI